jgi:TRAP-type mannitol/chloroaromatic compound transport system permease small subunit
MHGAVAFIDALNERIGRWVSWLTLFMVLLQFVIVLLRYVFGSGWIAAQEAVIYMHAAVFLGVAGYTLRHDGHVRVDIFYGAAGPRARAKVDLFGAIVLLLPMSVGIFVLSLPYVTAAWAVLEGSPQGQNGIPLVFLLKSLILVFAVLVALQGIALAIRSLAVLRGHVEDAPETDLGGHGV